MIAYLEEYRTIYRGRGIPALYDAEIFALATTPRDPEEADARGDPELKQQLESMAKSQAQMQQMISTLTTKLGKLSTPNGGGSDPSTWSERMAKGLCTHCGERGHMKAKCPTLSAGGAAKEE